MNFVMSVLIVGLCIASVGLILYTLRRQKPFNNQELVALIDERIAHTRGDAMEQILFGDQNSVWNAPHYAKLKGEVSEHLREAELDSVIVLIEHQRLKTLQIEELKLKLQLMEKHGEKNV